MGCSDVFLQINAKEILISLWHNQWITSFKNGFQEKQFFLAYLKAYWENMKSLLCSSYFCLNVLNHSPYFICQKPNKAKQSILISNIPMICHSPRHVIVTQKVPLHVLMKCSRFLTEAASAFYAALQLSYLLPFFICSELFIAALTITLIITLHLQINSNPLSCLGTLNIQTGWAPKSITQRRFVTQQRYDKNMLGYDNNIPVKIVDL